MRRELYASAGLHGLLLLWLVFGDALTRTNDPVDFQVTGVTLMSNAEFEAMTAPVVAPAEPEAPEPVAAPEPEVAPEAPAPEAPAPEVSQPEVAEAPAPETPPEPTEPLDTPRAEVTDEVAVLIQPEIGDPTAPPSETPTPQDIPRIAPLPAPTPEPEVEIAPEVVETPEPSEPTEEPEPEETETAPEEATTEIVTEAEEPSSAPLVSARPTARPERPAPAPEPETETAEVTVPEETQNDSILAALEEANADQPEPAAPAAPSGPPLSDGVISGFQRQVGQCWNTGRLSTAALETTIVVYFQLDRDGRPLQGSVRLVERLSGSEAGALQAFEAARIAVLRCGLNQFDGYDLPPESYERWREVEAVFNPEGMRLR